MKKHLILLLFLMTVSLGWSQPEPYPVDKTFIPELSFLQRKWEGEYHGIDPRSRTRLYVSRILQLNEDMTFINITRGGIVKNDVCVDTLLLKYEQGNYEYNKERRIITYILQSDSTLAMDAYISKDSIIEYTVNRYTETNGNNAYTEPVQFMAENDGKRAWVMQDSKLGSDQKQGMPAVYLMNASPSESDTLTYIHPMTVANKQNISNRMFDLKGREVNSIETSEGIIIHNGRKYLYKQ